MARSVGDTREAPWQYPVDDRDVDTPPGGPSAGYRVVVGSSPTGAFTGHAGEIAQYDGAAWVFTTPKQGTVVYVKDESDPYKQTAVSSPWVWGTFGSGLSEADHRLLDQLVHEIAETCYYETTYSGWRLTQEGWWTDSSKTTPIRVIDYTYSGPRISTEVRRQYDGSGILVETLTLTYVYSGWRVDHIDEVLT